MYWSMWGEEPQLVRANLDGTQRRVLITGQGRIQDLTIDYVDRRLYWADIDQHNIQSSDLLGEFYGTGFLIVTVFFVFERFFKPQLRRSFKI